MYSLIPFIEIRDGLGFDQLLSKSVSFLFSTLHVYHCIYLALAPNIITLWIAVSSHMLPAFLVVIRTLNYVLLNRGMIPDCPNVCRESTKYNPRICKQGISGVIQCCFFVCLLFYDSTNHFGVFIASKRTLESHVHDPLQPHILALSNHGTIEGDNTGCNILPKKPGRFLGMW